MKQKIKITYLTQPTIGFNQSGMKTQIDTLCSAFVDDENVEVSKFDIWENSFPDIVHYFGMSEGMLQVLKKFKSQGSKLICSPNHWPASSKVDKFLMKINYKDILVTNRVTKKYLIDNSDLFIVNSHGEKNMFVEKMGIESKKIKVIHNSYGDEVVKIEQPLFRDKYNVNGNFALMAGQIGSPRKNQLPIIKNWKFEYPHLYILGGYDDTAYGRKCIIEIKKKENITFLGFESDFNILESAYQHCELFISPGLIETPSLSAFRALINGAKLCSTNFGGCPVEYFSTNAKYFNPYIENEIIDTIHQSINNEKWPIDYEYLSKFSNNTISRKYKEKYLQLVK